MTNNLSYNNFVIENSEKKQYSSFLNRLNGNSKEKNKQKFKNEFFDNFKYNIPQFYINNTSKIRHFHLINSNLTLYNKNYKYLKDLLELNKKSFKIPTTNLNLKCEKEKNVIFENMDFGKAYDINYLIKNKKIFANINTFRKSLNIYRNINSSLFLKVINEKIETKEKLIFSKLYKEISKIYKKLLRINFCVGSMGYKNLFLLDKEKKNNNIKNNENKYKLIKPSFEQNIKNNNTNNKLGDIIVEYTQLYDSYNISKSMLETKKNIEENIIKFHTISLNLSQSSYTNVYDLLNLIIDQEYHLLNFILYFDDLQKFDKILKQDNKIKKYIKRNILNFSSYKDDYMRPVENDEQGLDLFKIPNYDVNSFFKQNEVGSTKLTANSLRKHNRKYGNSKSGNNRNDNNMSNLTDSTERNNFSDV